MKSPLKLLRQRAHRWWEWAAGIRAASELDSAKPHITGYFPLADTSEIVEYARPSSLLRSEFPTRLDLSLDLLFAPGEAVFMSGAHAREVRGVAVGWQEHIAQAQAELKLMRQHLSDPTLDAVNENLRQIKAAGLRNRAEQFVKLLRENYRWVFSSSHIRKPNSFERLLARLTIPSAKQLELPDGWQYAPNIDNVESWRLRLHDTGLGQREPGPNLIDAYALDQLHQIAKAQTSHTLPILLTHSGKIYEALRAARAENPDFFRVRGISLVQPPQMVLVLRLRADAEKNGRLDEVTEELSRQMARGEDVDELLRSPITGVSYPALEAELDEFEKNWDQWDALRQVLQSFQKQDDAPGMLDGLELILRATSGEDTRYVQELLGQELDRLITEVDRLQGEITNRMAPPDAPGPSELELTSEATNEIATVLVRFRSEATVPSAAYPIGSFHFRDPKLIEELARIDDARNKTGSRDEQTRLHVMWRDLHASNDRIDQPEFFLLLAVLYIAQEKWMQAYDMASQGLLVEEVSSSPAGAELYLARAGAGRAFVHSVRMNFPATCEAFLQSAIEDCLKSLELQHNIGSSSADGRCLRELAVIYCSSHDPVYGPSEATANDPVYEQRQAITVVKLKIDRTRMNSWVRFEGLDDPLRLAGALARKAYDLNANDSHAGVLYQNTHLYVMTELDRRALDANDLPPDRVPQHEKERVILAGSLKEHHKGDPNLLDTLMWHHRVLAEAQKRRRAPWEQAAHEAVNLSNQLTEQTGLHGNTNQYYARLVEWHQKRVQTQIGDHV